jgi:uncharacterized protein
VHRCLTCEAAKPKTRHSRLADRTVDLKHLIWIRKQSSLLGRPSCRRLPVHHVRAGTGGGAALPDLGTDSHTKCKQLDSVASGLVFRGCLGNSRALPCWIADRTSRRDIWPALPYSSSMDISFDPAKDAANVQERGILLAFGAVILARVVGELEDTRKDYGEVRQRAFAEVEGKWFQCVYTLRGDVRHIITVHRIDEKRVKRWLNR